MQRPVQISTVLMSSLLLGWAVPTPAQAPNEETDPSQIPGDQFEPAQIADDAIASSASSGGPIFHLTMDGDLINRGTIGGQARLYVAAGATAPQSVPGVFGSALHFSGGSVLALPFDLSNSDEESMTNCATWTGSVLCGNGQPATGLAVYATDNGNDRFAINGMRLICRAIAVPVSG